MSWILPHATFIMADLALEMSSGSITLPGIVDRRPIRSGNVPEPTASRKLQPQSPGCCFLKVQKKNPAHVLSYNRICASINCLVSSQPPEELVRRDPGFKAPDHSPTTIPEPPGTRPSFSESEVNWSAVCPFVSGSSARVWSAAGVLMSDEVKQR